VVFETERLVVREVAAADLEAILAVYLGNPDYLELTEGSAGEAGHYDLGMLERDLAMAQMTPGRVFAGVFDRESGEAVGILDWMDENPNDGKPWLGLIMIYAERQRQGLAAEALEGLAEHLRRRGIFLLREGVIESNVAGRALADRLGFELVERKTIKLASGEQPILVLERRLADTPSP
jgi:RimJ/RimL family protein N-acetyltransferase